ncbi:hypothetical protein HC256_004244 [Beauveria bassiana]|nr:hypothetical protein HC256_004244 [Beauveria bassiana]
MSSPRQISPSEVRLSPRPQDGYGWKPCPGYENTFSLLFAKNLSDHSISSYRLLSRQVGNTFEAVPADVGAEATDHIPLLHEHLQAAEDKIKELVEKARGYQAPLLKCFEELDRTVPILAELRRIAMEGVAPE